MGFNSGFKGLKNR